jgi:hypothetical protein
VPGLPLLDGYTVGVPRVLGNLAVFPVYAVAQEDLGDFTTLEAALEKGTAVVRELGAGSGEPAANDAVQQQAPGGDGAEVNTLVIDNKGDVPILVLAGTVVKGGKQDRQIGQDFLVGARETQKVDAFCVEHGRWTGTREGQATGGKFSTLKVLATSKVREAGQYKRDQSEVWSKVGEVNKAHKKQTASDTLVASLEDPAVVARREALARDAIAFLSGVESAGDVVGLAYAVDGKVRGARWFMHRKLFLQYQETLVNTATLEAVTAEAEAKASGQAAPAADAAPEAVVQFVTNVQTGRSEEQETAAENVNAYQFADEGYGSATYFKKGAAPPPAAAPAATGAAADARAPAAKPPPPKPKAITHDFLAK